MASVTVSGALPHHKRPGVAVYSCVLKGAKSLISLLFDHHTVFDLSSSERITPNGEELYKKMAVFNFWIKLTNPTGHRFTRKPQRN